MSNTLDKQQLQYYEAMIEHYKRYGRIGRTTPYNLEHAKRIAYSIIKKQITKNKSHSFSSRGGSVPSTGFQNYEQLKLF